jgi:DsbC/DsbD-like thiol-disulfide interchange protein
MAIVNLLALARATGNPTYRDHAAKALEAFSAVLAETPAAMTLGLVGLSEYLDTAAGPNVLKPLAGEALEAAPQAVVSAVVRAAGDEGAPIAPGKEFDAVVTVTIQAGWHIYANPTGLAEMKPTKLELDSSASVAASLVNVSYPEGKAQAVDPGLPGRVYVYEGKVELAARVRVVESTKAGSVTIPLILSYQACNDRMCEAPTKLKLPWTIKVKRDGAIRR